MATTPSPRQRAGADPGTARGRESAPGAGRRRVWPLVAALAILVLMLGIGAMCLGNYRITPLTVARVLASRVPGVDIVPDWPKAAETVILQVRMPRTLGALMVGGALSLSGATYQGVFKNPLVSPDLLGVSAGACVGAASAILLHTGRASLQVLALATGLGAVALATFIPRLLRNTSTMALVLSGIIVAGLMNSTLGLLKYMADPETELAEITYWMMGSFSQLEGTEVMVVLPIMAAAATVLLALRWRINLLSLGDQQARSLGVPLRPTRLTTITCATALTGCAVCISGTVGWVGLVVPHIGRLIAGPDNTRLLPVSLVVGGAFMLVVDTAARTLSSAEIPLSILTGFIGAPLYIWLLFQQRVRLQ